MIRRILVPLDPSPYTDTALIYASHIARRSGAEITGLAVLDIPGIEHSLGSVPVGGIYFAEKLIHQKQDEAQKHVRELLETFEKTCKQRNVYYRLAERQGSPSATIIEESLYYDLLVMGLRTFYHYETTDSPGDSLEDVLDATATPLIAVPATDKPPEGKMRMLVAFDGSPPAARALHRLTMLSDVFEIDATLLVSCEDEDEGMRRLNNAAAYLFAHSISNVQKEWTDKNITKVIEDEYIDGVDGVVLGTHSKARVFDFILGSLCRLLIKRGDKFLLIGS